MKQTNYLWGYTQAALSAIGFGTMGVIGVMAYQEGFSTSDLLSWRFGIASIILIFISLYRGLFKDLSPKKTIICLLMGIIGYTGMTLLFFNSIKYIEVGLATVLLYTYPIFVLAISRFTDKNQINLHQLFLIILAFIGLFFAIDFSSGNINWIGITLGISTAIWYSIYLKIGEKIIKDIDPIFVSTFVSIGAFLSYFFIAIYSGGLIIPSSKIGWISVLTLAIFSTVFAIILLFQSIEKIGAVKASLISNLEPVTAIILGLIFLSETLSISQFFGMGMILMSITLLITANKKVKPI